MANVSWKSPPTAAELLESARDKQRKALDKARDEAIEAGFKHDFDGTTDTVQTRQRDRENLTGLAVSAQRHPSMTFHFRAKSNTTYTLTADDILALADAAQRHVSQQYETNWQLKAEVEAAKTVEVVNAIIW